jgi:hypothetical protein
MTLASHLLSAMDPNTAPIQTPHRPGYHQAYTAQTPRSVVAGNDGSQFGAHHGSFPPPSPWAMLGDGGGGFGYGMPTPGRFTEWSADRVSTMQARLQRRLGPEYVTTRPGPGGGPKLR